MAGDAVKECITGAALDPARTAILLGIRELSAEPGGERQNHRLLALVARACGATFHRLSEVLPDGNCAIATGLIRAARLLAAGEVECCIVGGVDSYLTHEDIERYDRLARVKNRNNGRGFIPGEAATVVAVALHGRHRSLNAIEPTILGVGVAREEQSRTALSDGHPNGRAVQQALLTAVDDARVDEQALAFRVADLNGERYGCQDSILGAHRFYRSYRKQMPIIFPAASVGETGAAAGALGVIIAAVAMTKGYAPGNLAMCEAASDGGLRSGVVVGAADRGRV
jgi:3-oxoacyl-[acyl-carrier-protein] synthase-1